MRRVSECAIVVVVAVAFVGCCADCKMFASLINLNAPNRAGSRGGARALARRVPWLASWNKSSKTKKKMLQAYPGRTNVPLSLPATTCLTCERFDAHGPQKYTSHSRVISRAKSFCAPDAASLLVIFGVFMLSFSKKCNAANILLAAQRVFFFLILFVSLARNQATPLADGRMWWRLVLQGLKR